MPERDSYAPGTFSWTDLMTTDASAAKDFYNSLFGWEYEDNQTDQAGVIYTMCRKNARDAAGLGEMNDEMKNAGMPPVWSSYVTVANAADAAEKAEKLGANIMLPPMDVMDAGRMAIIIDTSGAALSVWEPKENIGAGVVNEGGALCWNELNTKDIDASKDFYGELFGWTFNTVEIPGPAGETSTYTEIQNNGNSNGGILQMNEEWGDIPPHWMVYFATEDTDATAEKAKAGGGNILVPSTDIPAGRFSVLQDPQGGTFTIIALPE